MPRNFKHTPEEARKLWVEALQSGEYKQTTSTLRRTGPRGGNESFCCLGVACEVYRKAEGVGRWDTNDGYGSGTFFPTENPTDRGAGTLPEVVKNWLGLATPWASQINDIRSLTDLNDTSKWSFKDLAQLIIDDEVTRS